MFRQLQKSTQTIIHSVIFFTCNIVYRCKASETLETYFMFLYWCSSSKVQEFIKLSILFSNFTVFIVDNNQPGRYVTNIINPTQRCNTKIFDYENKRKMHKVAKLWM